MSVLSLTLVYCGQTVGLIKMKLGMQVGLVPGHTVIDRDLVALPKGAQPPIFGPCLLWPNGRPSQLLTSTSRVPCTKVLYNLLPVLGFFTPFDRSRRARQAYDVRFFLILQHRESYKPSKNGAICAWAYLLFMCIKVLSFSGFR